MGVLISLAYLALTILSPADLFPTLAGSRLLVWVAIAACIGSIPCMLRRGILLVQGTAPLVLGMIAAVCMSILAQGWLTGAITAAQTFIPSAIIYYLVVLNFESPGKLRLLAWAFFVPTLYTAVAGLLAFSSGTLTSPYVLVVGENIVRAVRLRGTGFLQDPNDFGQQLVVAMALMPLLARKGGFLRVLLWLTAPIFLYAIYLTQSRGTLLGLGVLLIFAGQKRLGRFKSGLLVTALMAGYFALGFATDRGISMGESSSKNRMTLWGDGIQMLLQSPLFGIGFKNFADEAGQTAHNSFVLCFAELGLFGYICWMTLLVLAFKQLGHLLSPASDTDPEVRRGAYAFRNALITFLVTGWFLSRTYVITIYLICGAIQVLYALDREKAPATAARFRINTARVFGLSFALQVASLMIIYVIVRIRWLMW